MSFAPARKLKKKLKRLLSLYEWEARGLTNHHNQAMKSIEAQMAAFGVKPVLVSTEEKKEKIHPRSLPITMRIRKYKLEKI